MKTIPTIICAVMLLAAAGCGGSNQIKPAPTNPTSAAPEKGAMKGEHKGMSHGGMSHGMSHGGAEAPEEASGGAPVAFDSAPAAGTRAKCPVAGKVFTVTKDTATSEHGGKHYAFCCPGCKPKFDANPQEFLNR